MNPGGNILLIRLKSIGDILFMLPAVHAVRENFPGAKITFLTSRENAPLLQGFREVDEVITLDRARFQSGNPRTILAEAFSLFRRLRGGKFSLVVDFQGYGETAWLAWLSGAPQRWGSVYGPGRRWAYTRGVTRDDRLHHVDRTSPCCEQCGLHPGEIRNEFVLPDDALNEARRFFAGARFESGPAHAVHPAVHQLALKKLAAGPSSCRGATLARTRSAGFVRRRSGGTTPRWSRSVRPALPFPPECHCSSPAG